MKGRGHKDSPPGQSPVQGLFQRLERLEDEVGGTGHAGNQRWMIPYADLLTLLLGLFLVILTAAHTEKPPEPEVVSMAALQETSSQKASQASDSQNLSPDKAEKRQEDLKIAAQLEEQLKTGLDIKGIEFRQQERGLVISLKDSILFAPGSAELSPEARRTLDRLARNLQATLEPPTSAQARPIRVEGHTDNTPIGTAQFPSNWELSTARATNIVRYLVSAHHFDPQRMSAAGYGEFKPVAQNSTIEGKQKNRRVDIVVLNNLSAQEEPPVIQKSDGIE